MHKRNTMRVYVDNCNRLKEFFGSKLLKELHIGHIRGYQKYRLETAGPGLINSECSRLQTLLKEAKMWKQFEESYKPLPVPKIKVRQNMSEDEEKRLMVVAMKPGKRLVAGHCLVIMMNTTMGFGELSHVRRCDLKLDQDIPYVEVNAAAGGAKNDYRARTIPLNFYALRSFRYLVERWRKSGGSLPEQYILFKRANVRQGKVNFYEPMGHIYAASRLILDEAKLSHLDPYDMRSHAITKILSNPRVSAQVAQELAGHISAAMQSRYSKQRLETKRVAMDAFGGSMMEEAAMTLERARKETV
jgi:integrase